MSDGKTIPIKYQVERGVENPKVMSIKCTDADDNENKEECPIFTNDSPLEILIQIADTILSLEDTYGWCENEKGKMMFQHLGRALRGEPQRKWKRITKNARTFTVLAFLDKWYELTEEIMGPDAYDDQLEYLTDTRQPRDMALMMWIDRVEVANQALGLLKKGESEMADNILIKKIIAKNLGPAYQKDFIMQDKDKKTKLKDAKSILRKIERAVSFEKKGEMTEKKLESRLKQLQLKNKKGEEDQKGGATPKRETQSKECRLPGHKHSWSDCENNPNSKNYNGTNYFDVWKKHKNKTGEAYLIGNEDEGTGYGTSVSFAADFKYETASESEEEFKDIDHF